jgi:hypothetical protein
MADRNVCNFYPNMELVRLGSHMKKPMENILLDNPVTEVSSSCHLKRGSTLWEKNHQQNAARDHKDSSQEKRKS